MILDTVVTHKIVHKLIDNYTSKSKVKGLTLLNPLIYFVSNAWVEMKFCTDILLGSTECHIKGRS